jgi:hypothetical protein
VLTVTQAEAGLTSITTTANTIVASAGSFITAGLRVGDVITLAGVSDAANTGKLLRIVALTATVITVAETLVVNATPDTSFSIVRSKKLLQGLTPKAFVFEENEADIDVSNLFTWCRVGSFEIRMEPNGEIIFTFNFTGRDMEIIDGAEAPYFTAPTETVSIAMTAVESVIRFGDEDVFDFTAATLGVNLNAAGTEVVGANKTPDVFTNLAQVTGSVTALRQDAVRQRKFWNEEQLSLHILAVDSENPLDFCSLVLTNLTLGGGAPSDIGADGPRTESYDLLPGKDERGGAFDPTMIKYQTSAV